MKSVSILILTLLLAAGFGLSACNRSDNVEAAREPDARDRADDLSADDTVFLDYLAGMHAGEIQMAQLAKQKSSREDIKEYADQVIESHSDALEKLSDKMGRPLEYASPSLDTQRHSEYLSSLSGSQFDQEFIALMIADHQDAAGTFKTPFLSVQNKQLTDYTKDELAAIEENLREAQNLQK